MGDTAALERRIAVLEDIEAQGEESAPALVGAR